MTEAEPGSTDLRRLSVTIRARWRRCRRSTDHQYDARAGALSSHPTDDAQLTGHRWIQAELAELHCESCDRVTEHELRYAGRLLDSVRCTRCDTRLDVPARDMLPSYLVDLEQRLASKPSRMLRRAGRDPVGFALTLPRAIVQQPVKLLSELRSVMWH